MKAYERFYNLMKGKPIDRLPAIEWAPWWNLTVDRWHKEGLPETCNTLYDIQNFFGLDKCIQTLLPNRTAETPLPPVYGHGIMKNEADYERIKPTLFPEIRLPDEYVAWLKKTREDGDTLHFFTVEGFFWFPRELFGIEDHLYSFTTKAIYTNAYALIMLSG